MVTDLLNSELKRAGKAVVRHLCEHFAYSRTELFAIVKTKKLRTFTEVLTHAGAGSGRSGSGCEICKPAVASILASLWNEDILRPEHQTLQDTNVGVFKTVNEDGSFQSNILENLNKKDKSEKYSHCTIKPLGLIKKLVETLCPLHEENIIFDPFTGSGTTLVAAQELGLLKKGNRG